MFFQMFRSVHLNNSSIQKNGFYGCIRLPFVDLDSPEEANIDIGLQDILK